MFKDLRSGSVVYVLDKRETPRFYTAMVKSVSGPYFPQLQPGQFTPVQQQFVNLIIENQESWGVPADGLTVTKEGLTVSCSRDNLLTEVTALHSSTMEMINSHEKLKEDARAYEQIMRDLDPAYAKTKAQDEKIEGLQSEIASLASNVKSLVEIINKQQTVQSPAPTPVTPATSASSKTTSKSETK